MGMRFSTAMAVTAVLLCIVGIWLFAPAPQGQEPKIDKITGPAASPDLGGEKRYHAHLSTDKPMYRPGERLYGRAVIMNTFTRKPVDQAMWTRFEIRSARGEVVAQLSSSTENGVAPLGWQIPENQTGGVYKLLAFPGDGSPEAEMSFDIRAYRVPRLRTDLQFIKKAYGPGEEVTATLSATRAEGGIPAGAKVTAVATVDGAEVHRGNFSLNDKGIGGVAFKLPPSIKVGDGTLALVIEDGGVQETAGKTIPIVINQVALTFYPEGGDLVAGVENRIYFEAQTPKQDPADVSGRVLDESGKEVARFESVHEGRGKFSVKAVAGARYRAVLDKPAGIKDAISLPAVQASGFAVTALDDAVPSDKPVRVRLTSPVAAGATVGLYIKERELARETVILDAGKPKELALDPKTFDGVLRVTVYDAEGQPRAERLVFRKPRNGVRVEVQVDAKQTVPSGKVNVTVRTTDESGKPVSAVVGLAAVDDAVLETVDKRDRAPRLPVQALLGSEVRELKDAHVYLSNDANAPVRTDLLLGTQGWRRFGFVKVDEFIKQHEAVARRAVAKLTPPKPMEAPAGEMMRAVQEAAPERVPAPRMSPPPVALKVGAAVDKDMLKEVGVRQPPAPVQKGKIAQDPLKKQRFAGNEKEEWAADELQMPAPPAWARIYAHEVAPNKPKGERTDFTETVYWNAGLATDKDGKAQVSFHVSDSVTTFRLRADGFTKDGALGESDATVEVQRPFYTEPKFPLEITRGDRIELPISIVNRTNQALEVKLDTTVGKGLSFVGQSLKPSLAANASDRAFVTLKGDAHQGPVDLKVSAKAGPYSDDVTRKISVVPSGFPIEINIGSMLEVVDRRTITIPDKIEAGSLTTQVAVYPSPLASLTQALAALLQEPYGCFEQTSSTTYPTIMALQYMKSHSGVDPALVRRASDLVEKGYKRLVSFECSNKGYEWFGQNPGHEALSAYGVMEFTDMSKVYPVDGTMLDRTRQWLLSRRDGKGGFLRDPKALDSFGGAPDDITNAYILWSLVEAGQTGLDKELAWLKDRATKTEDTYFLALAANVLLGTGDRTAAEGIMSRITGKQHADGSMRGAQTSVTRSGGECLEIETTSLSILAWLKTPKFTANTEKAMRWLMERCKGGRFGSTQSTVLALRAIIAYDGARAKPKRPGTVTLTVDKVKVGEVAFLAGHEGPIVLPDFSGMLTPGKHEVEIKMDGGADMPYSMQVKYHAPTPASSDQCKVRVQTALSKDKIAEGEPVDVNVEVSNTAKEGLPMVVAIVGLPGGVEARADQLKELVRSGRVDAFETLGREVILYWRSMAPEAKHALTLSCIAAIPGEYTGPASRAYLYYTDEQKHWVPGLKATITRR